jgi:putative Holliday junction resolvase
MPTRKPETLPKTGKIICFDVGSKTLGVAISDISRIIASPHKTIQRKKWGEDKKIIQALISENNIVAAVVGLPLHMSGDISKSSQSAENFALLVEKECDIPVLMWDERLSTAAAENSMFEMRTGRQKRMSKKDSKQAVDSVAASLILQSVLPVLGK